MTLDKTVTSPRASDGDAAASEWGLRVVFPTSAKRWLPLTAGASWQTIGRDEAGIDHPTVSRAHLAIRRRGLVLEVKDSGSHNGTWLDGGTLGSEPRYLGNHPVLRVGDTLAVIERRAVADDTSSIDPDALPGDAPCMRSLRPLLARMASGSSHVLLQGETGTGKELAASEIHRLSGRSPLVTFNCAGLSAVLADSQLFGHEKGAFTGAARSHEGLFRRANGGTLFLDELAELLPSVQAKLLRVLETGEVQPLGGDRVLKLDVRVIAATQPDLEDLVAEGRFRRDLHARLSLASTTLPAVRERRGDIPEWLLRFERRWRDQEGGAALDWRPAAVEAAMLAPHDDNLRGLDRLVYQLRLRHGPGSVVTADVVHEILSTEAAPSRAVDRPPKPNKEELQRALERFGGSVRATAKHYRRERRQIYRWMQAHGLRS